MPETDNSMKTKIAAAKILGLETVQSYQTIGDSFYMVITILPQERVFSLPIDKNQQLALLQQQKNLLVSQEAAIDEEINKINET